MHCAKAVKDIRHNLEDITQTSNAALAKYAGEFRVFMQTFLENIYSLRREQRIDVGYEDLATILQQVHRHHDSFHEKIYSGIRDEHLDERNISTLLNVNRELLTSARSLLLALGSYYLEKAQAENLEQMPV